MVGILTRKGLFISILFIASFLETKTWTDYSLSAQ